MPYDVIKRNVYANPFEYPHSAINHHDDQEEFHLPWMQMHNAHLHSQGVADGLEVSGAVGDASITIQPGAAITNSGLLVSLSDDGQADLGVDPPGGQHDYVSVPVSLSLASHAGETVFITITPNEVLRISGGSSGGKWEQVPWIHLQSATALAASTVESIILGIVEIDGAGNLASLRTTGTSPGDKRQLAGVPAETISIRRVHKSGNTLQQVESGKIGPVESGGVDISVPNTGDTVSISKEGGGLFSRIELNTSNVVARDSAQREAVTIESAQARLTVGTNGSGGDLRIRDSAGRIAMDVAGNNASLGVGVAGNEGDITVRDNAGDSVFHANGATANIRVGGGSNAGEVHLYNGPTRTIRLDGQNAVVDIGTNDVDGDITVRDSSNRGVFNVNGDGARVRIGTSGHHGNLEVRDSSNRVVMEFTASNALLALGGTNEDGDIWLRNSSGDTTINLDGQAGAIYASGMRVAGNPARYVHYVYMYAESGTNTYEVDLGSSRPFYAFTAMTGMDPLHNHDSGDAFVLEVYRVDGVRTSSIRYGGDHLGGDGATTNMHRTAHRATGRRILFRARSFQNAEVYGIGVVFYE